MSIPASIPISYYRNNTSFCKEGCKNISLAASVALVIFCLISQNYVLVGIGLSFTAIALCSKRKNPNPEMTELNPKFDKNYLFPIVSLWQVTCVGPYKGLGYTEMNFKDEAEKKFEGAQEIGDLRRQLEWKLSSELKLKAEQAAGKFQFDNLPWDINQQEHLKNPRVYHPQSLYELVKLNIDAIVQEADNKNLAQRIRQAADRGNVQECASLFVETMKPTNEFTALVQAAWGNEPTIFNKYEILRNGQVRLFSKGKSVLLPAQGMGEMYRLKNKFPAHSWHTIRFFLVYFHRFPKENPFQAASELLSKISPVKNRVFYIHPENGHCYSVIEDHISE